MNPKTWKTWSLDKGRIFDGYVFATPGDRCRYIGTSVRDRPQWLKKNVGRWRRIEDVQQEAAPPAPPVESEIDLGAEPAGPNGQTSSRGVRDNSGDEDDVALVDTLAGDRSPPHAPASPPPVKPTVTKGSTKAELLSRAKAAIEAGESFLRDAAEALALAQKAFNASQREIAEAIGRSASWVNRLLKWRRSGYKEYSPFGPTTKAGRVAHAQQQAKASKLRKPEATTTKTPADAETSSSSVDAETSTSRKPSPAEAKRNLMYAIRRWWPYMDHAGKVEITAFFLKQKGVPASGAIDPSRASSAIS